MTATRAYGGARRVGVLAAVLGLWVSGCATAPRHPVRSPLGAPVVVVPTHGETVRGELLAVSAESLWVLDERTAIRVPTVLLLRDVRTVRVQHGRSSVPRATLTGLILGVGVAVQAHGSAWASEGASVVAGFSAIGLLLGAERAGLATLIITPPTPHALAPWARFPQGMPGNAQDSLPRD